MIDLKPGDRIKLIEMPNDPNPIEPGVYGTVTEYRYPTKGICPHGTVTHGVRWDNGRALSIILPMDQVELLTPEIIKADTTAGLKSLADRGIKPTMSWDELRQLTRGDDE